MKNSVLKFITRKKLKGGKFVPTKNPILPERREIGLYVHIPFCKVLCPFCPYNRYHFRKEIIAPYISALKEEIGIYKKLLGDIKINSLYIGGGTPTLICRELTELVKYVRSLFTVNEISAEANPDDLSDETLELLLTAGIKKLSIGVQSFADEILKNIGRLSHNGKTAFESIKRTLPKDFSTVNVDLMFGLPGQTFPQLKTDLETLVDLKVPQITFYPLLLFPYTRMAKNVKAGKIKIAGAREEKRMFNEIISFLSSRGYAPATVWSFTRKNVEKYGSVEREEYFGVGAGAMSVTDVGTYANTFSVEEYINTLNKGILPIAFGHPTTKEEAMAKWFNMRLYELGFSRENFFNHFGMEVEKALPHLLRTFSLLKIITIDDRRIKVPPTAFYSIHLMTKTFLTTYIARICEEGIKHPWPEQFNL